MNDVQQRAAAKHFADYWKGKGYEKGESQKFWLSLLTDVFGVEHAAEYISFEDQVHLDHTSFIDGYIPETHVLIEQKSIDKDLKKPIRQSDGTLLTPRQQAQRYIHALLDEKGRDAVPKWVVICNFAEFHIYDMVRPQSEPIEIKLEDLPAQYYLLGFLVRKEDLTLQKEMEISIQAGELVGKLYDAFLKEYKDPVNERSLQSLNALCVRLVFCLYAEDAGIFGRRLMFHDYLQRRGLMNARRALIDLFRVLDTRIEDRDKYMDDDLVEFPYVNGGLFSDENIEIPRLNQTIYDLLLNKASAGFDWSEISPTIFGAVFESTLNPETRRSGGMHYTSIENIHKVIDPLFLDGLKAELEEIKGIPVLRQREQKLRAFQDKLASLRFLDPAAGSGNFLTESYLCLRALENEVIFLLQGGQISMGEVINPIKVSIGQFYGIEINDFAATVARTALWIAESQMMKRTEDIVHMELSFLPLKSYVNIICGNALRMDWNDVVPARELSYICGNPPFLGARVMSAAQKADVISVFGKKWKNVGNLDYVSCWYKKTVDLMSGTQVQAALVSTNSITQGEAVADLWKPLFEKGTHINFAYRTFKWDSEANTKAHVHCVIVGFSTAFNKGEKVIYDGETRRVAKNINGYLVDGDDICIENREKPLCPVPEIGIGNKLVDFGYYIFTKDEMEEFIRKEPKAAKYFKPWVGGNEFIKLSPNDEGLFILWLGECTPDELRKMPKCIDVVKSVQQARLNSKSPGTIKLADYPTRFHVENMPKGNYIVIPVVSSERRKYIPIGYMDERTLCSQKLMLMPKGGLYHFGIITSNVHMSWMRTVCGRLKSDYSYSKNIVYNNFPWPEATEEQKAKIEKTAQGILNARALYPDASLADLYDERTMPPELRTAHQRNDRAVMEAYGMPVKETTESSCVAELMRRYQALTAAEGGKT